MARWRRSGSDHLGRRASRLRAAPAITADGVADCRGSSTARATQSNGLTNRFVLVVLRYTRIGRQPAPEAAFLRSSLVSRRTPIPSTLTSNGRTLQDKGGGTPPDLFSIFSINRRPPSVLALAPEHAGGRRF